MSQYVPPPTVAIIGGSGLCRQDIFDTVAHLSVQTPYGSPSDEVEICSTKDVEGHLRTVAYLPRHGRDHSIAPDRIPYRANIDALRQLGVRRILSTCISGSLKRRIRPGDLIVPDQFVNLTWNRDPEGPEGVVHTAMADPYCASLRSALWQTSRSHRVHRRGTVVVIQGPRFSTRAESRWFRRQGWHLVNMTQYPEVAIAREHGLCYASVAAITDYDVGLGARHSFADAAHLDRVLATFRSGVDLLKMVLREVVPEVEGTCASGCQDPRPGEYYRQGSE